MSSTLASLVVKLVGDTAGFSESLGGAEKDAQGFVQRMSEVGPKVALAGAGLTAGVTMPILGLFDKAVAGASDLSETVSKANVVFGDNAKQIAAWGNESAKALGMSQQEALGAASTYGNLFVSMGMTSDKSADMSKNLVGLAADLASFNNMAGSDVMEKLRAGLTGESEPLKALGVNINAAMIEAKALSMGLVKTEVDMNKVNGATLNIEKAQNAYNAAVAKYGADSLQARDAQQRVANAQAALTTAMAGSNVEMDAATKAQAAYALILEQTKTAQGDFARTSDGLANSTRITNAELDNAVANLGTSLVPIITQVTQGVGQLIAQFNAMPASMQQMIVVALAIAAGLGPVLTIVGSLMTVLPAVAGAFGAVSAVIGGPVIVVIALVVAAIAALAYAWDHDLGGIRETAADLWSLVMQIFGKGEQFIKDHATEIETTLRIGWETIKTIITIAVQFIGGVLKAGLQLINGDWAGAWQTMQETVSGIGETIKGYLETTGAEFVRLLSAAWVDMTGKAEIKWNQLKDTITGAIGAAIKWIGEQGTALSNLGQNIISGIIAGITSAPQSILNTLSGIVNGAIDSIKKQLGIASPSTVFAGIGKNMMTGMAMGIEKAGELPSVQLNGVVSGLADVSLPSTSGGGRAGNQVSIEMHFHGNADADTVRNGTMDALRRAGLIVTPA